MTSLNENTFQISMSTKLTLSLSGNSFQCDSEMCWIKQAEEMGKIMWHERSQKPKGKTNLCELP